MDNNNEQKSEKKPAPKKKKVSKKVLRQRQLCALACIAFILLIIIIFIAKGCSNSTENQGESSEPQVTTTAPEIEITTIPPETTTEVVTTMNPLAANVQLDKRELFVNVGDYNTSVYARIERYPDENTGEANEVWKSMDESIATVNEWGAVTGVSVGETYVILSFDNHPEIEIEIKVHVADASVITYADAPVETVPYGDTAEPSVDTPTTPVYGYTDDGTF